MDRRELLALRSRVMRGEPSYEIDPVMGAKVRKSGTRGLHELRDIGNFDASAAPQILAFETIVALIDHLLEKFDE